MKLLFHKYPVDRDIKLGLNWFKHHNDNKYWGFTLSFHVVMWTFCLTFVSNWAEYNKKQNFTRFRRK
jgi:hypothetical protein